jgi:hypothetical protein
MIDVREPSGCRVCECDDDPDRLSLASALEAAKIERAAQRRLAALRGAVRGRVTVSEERPTVTLEYLAEQQRRMLAAQRTMIDDINVMAAIVRRIDNTQGALLDEMRAIHSLLARVVDRVRVLEEKG